MLKWLFLDIKRNLKSKKVLILFVIIFGTMFWHVYNFNPIDEEFYEYIELEQYGYLYDIETIFKVDLSGLDADERYKFALEFIDIAKIKDEFDSRCLFQDFYAQHLQEAQNFKRLCHNFNIYQEHVQDLITYYLNGDTENYRKLKIFVLDLATDYFFEYFETLDPKIQTSLSKSLIDFNYVTNVKSEVEKMDLKYEPFYVQQQGSFLTKSFNRNAKDLFENYHFLINDYPLDVNYQSNFGFFIATYIEEYFILLIFTVIILIFDNYYRDFNSGVFKTVLSSPKKRYTYVILKTLSSIISSLILIFIPLITVSIYLYVTVGYTGLNYPVYIRKNTLSSINPPLKYTRVISGGDGKHPDYFSTYSNICSYGPISKFPIDYVKEIGMVNVQLCHVFMTHQTIRLIMLNNYLMLVLIYFVLVIIFLSLLNTLFSILLNNRIINLLVLSSYIGFGLLLLKVLYGSKILRFIPTTFLSPTKLLMLTIPYTYFNGVLVLIVSILILTILSNYLINHKDFTY